MFLAQVHINHLKFPDSFLFFPYHVFLHMLQRDSSSTMEYCHLQKILLPGKKKRFKQDYTFLCSSPLTLVYMVQSTPGVILILNELMKNLCRNVELFSSYTYNYTSISLWKVERSKRSEIRLRGVQYQKTARLSMNLF